MSSTSSFGTESIVGTVIGGVFILVTVIGIIISIYAMCCRKDPNSQVRPENNPNNGRYQSQQGPYGQQTNTGYYGNQYPPNQQWGNPAYNNQPPPYQNYDPKSYQSGKY